MRTVHCSSHLPGGGVSAQGGVCPGVSTQGGLPGGGGVHLPPVDRILDTRLWKHCLSTTSFADGNNV